MAHLLRKTSFEEILDVGAGSGFFSRYLLNVSDARQSVCVDINYAEDKTDHSNGKPVHYLRSIEKCNADLVLLMDVLEHVDRDLELLQDYVGKVAAGTTFFISVPAFNFLWSSHDVFLEHKRRYTLPQLERIATQAGLEVLRGCYFFGAVFPIAATLRLADRFRGGSAPHPRPQLRQHDTLTNGLLAALCTAELPFMELNRLAGISAFCLATKPG